MGPNSSPVLNVPGKRKPLSRFSVVLGTTQSVTLAFVRTQTAAEFTALTTRPP